MNTDCNTDVTKTKKYDFMEHKTLTKTIKKELKKDKLDPIVPLSKCQECHLKEGDGQKKKSDEYKQVNSSTGLAVNFFKILEKEGSIHNVVFEEKVAKPIKQGGRYANLDVRYEKKGEDTIYYVESKFLEPYYSGNKDNTAYIGEENRKKYDDIENYQKWDDLFKTANKFNYYNASQLCTHLLAIYRSVKEKEYPGKIVLQSIIWDMPDSFIEIIESKRSKTYLKKRRDRIRYEKKECMDLINNHIKDIGWKNMRFETLTYNEEKDKIKDSDLKEEFCRRYFFN